MPSHHLLGGDERLMEAGAETGRIDTVLLLGLPACGKSTIRQRLSTLPADAADMDLHVGPTVQLDDFPYVHFIWRVYEITRDMGQRPVYFEATGETFDDVHVWGALLHLLNEDFAALESPTREPTPSAGEWILGRLEDAGARVGMPSPFERSGPEVRARVAAALEDEAAEFAAEWSARRRPRGSTAIIEFARGGPEGAEPPLHSPFGYGWALSLLSADILRRAVVLYVWVTPDESRRRNRKRAEPGAHGSTMHHAVPERVMRECYGIDDMGWLIEHGERAGTITVRANGMTHHLPVARIDNRHEIGTDQRNGAATREKELDEHIDTTLREAFAELAAHLA